MDIGKAGIHIGQTYLGDPDSALKSVFISFASIAAEFLVTPGTASILASVSIARGAAVNINNGQLRLADASLSRPAIGICIRAATIGQKADIILGSGYAKGLTGLTANSSIYLGNAGALLFAKPGAGMIQGLGFSLSTTEMFVTISQP